MRTPRHLFDEWEKVLARAHRASRLVLCLDFDGTLAPIRQRPQSVWLAADARRLVQRIARGGTLVAIISGRGLTDLRRRARIRGIWLAGAHGYFVESREGRRYSLLSKRQEDGMKGMLRSLREKLRGLRGIQIEPKEATAAVHYRRADRQNAHAARRIVERLSASAKEFRLMHGKKVWEILPASPVDKWTAVRFILKKQIPGNTKGLLFYLGDDTTDEAVFRKMKGISVAVGKQQGTAARYFLRSPAEVKLFLKRWNELEQ
jgi:trehalose-phosphatase